MPSKLTFAESFLFSVTQNGLPPLTVTGRALNPIIGQHLRNASSIIDNGYTITFTGYFPDYSVSPGRYEISVISPASGPEANKGTGSRFTLQYPFIWMPAPYGQCILPSGDCGVGLATRQVTRHLTQLTAREK